MIGDPKLASSIASFLPATEVVAVFRAAPKPRRPWLGVVFVLFVFFVVSGQVGGSIGVSALASGGSVGGAMLLIGLVRPHPIVVGVTEHSMIVVEMDKLRTRRARRVLAVLSRIEGRLEALPSRSPATQQFTMAGASYVTAGVSADVVRRVAACGLSA